MSQIDGSDEQTAHTPEGHRTKGQRRSRNRTGISSYVNNNCDGICHAIQDIPKIFSTLIDEQLTVVLGNSTIKLSKTLYQTILIRTSR